MNEHSQEVHSMEKSIKDDLCKSLRACGLPKDRAYPILNKISKWVDSCGVEWTNERLKELHVWYITYLAGKPEIPEWFSHHPDGTPKGEFRFIFGLKNQQLALAILSCHTVFRNKDISTLQWEKLEKALNTEGKTGETLSPSDSSWLASLTGKRRVPQLTLTPIPLDSLTGRTIPVGRSKVHVDPLNKDSYATAYLQTCRTLPKATVRFFHTVGAIDYLPGGQSGKLASLAWDNTQYGDQFWRENVCGHISCIQEASLKARWIANPNRGTQHALRSLQQDWSYSVEKRFRNFDYTLNQEKGVSEVQQALRKGIPLASVDMTSATDLLSVTKSIDLLLLSEFGHSFKDPWWRVGQGLDLTPSTKASEDERNRYVYWRHVNHFLEISQGQWLAPNHKEYSWKQGQPLGTAPSFSLLAYTNNMLARLAYQDCSSNKMLKFYWAVIGDDIVINHELFERYKVRVQEFGGVINPQKTIVSNKLAEFGGHVISATQSSVKRVKWPVLSDNNFIEVASALGPQTVGALLPRQKVMYRTYKHVPGVIVNGPWSMQSHGQPLADRYLWYLIDSGLANPRTEPDKAPKLMGEQLGLYLEYFVREVEPEAGKGGIYTSYLPTRVPKDFQSLDAARLTVHSGDPRKHEGLSTLEYLERNSKGSLKRDLGDALQESLGLEGKVILSDDGYHKYYPRVFPEKLELVNKITGKVHDPNLPWYAYYYGEQNGRKVSIASASYLTKAQDKCFPVFRFYQPKDHGKVVLRSQPGPLTLDESQMWDVRNGKAIIQPSLANTRNKDKDRGR
uniref:Putative replicase n=1 Tax=Mansystermes virus TaxID=2796613 RepID=A0A894KQP5_9VIRU|nr:putative replicase [Mansystermes virus]